MFRRKNKASSSADEVIAVLRRIISENAREFIPQYSIAALCMLAIAATTSFTAWIMRSIVDDLFVEQRWNMLVWICISILIAFTIRGLASYGQSVLMAQVGNNIVARYQRRLFQHLMQLDLNYFTTARSGHLAAQIAQNVMGIRDLLNMTITAAVRDFVSLIGLVGVMIFMDPLLSMVALIIGPPLILTVNYLMRRLRTITRESVEINARLIGAMQEAVQGVAIVKAFTMEQQLAERMSGLIDFAENRSNKIARVSERLGPVTEVLAGAAIAAVIAYAGWRAATNAEPPGSVFAFITALLLAYDPARKLARVQVNIERALVNARMIYEILDRKPQQSDPADAVKLRVEKAEIEFKDVHASYEEGTPVLRGVSFIAKAGETTAIIGPSGAGKSTLFALLQRFYDLDGGSISIDGQDISTVTKHSLRSSIAYVSQQPYLFEGSIRDNIRYGRPEATDAEIEQAARLANADDFISQQRHGYETLIGENGVTLSGGQRQRISIARAIVRNAPVLLLDEATSALDNESEAKVQEALDRVMHERTTIVIAHRLSTVVGANQIVVLEDGNLIETGTHQSLVDLPNGLYARFYRVQKDKTGDDKAVAELDSNALERQSQNILGKGT